MSSAPNRGSRVQALLPIKRARNAFEIKGENCGAFILLTAAYCWCQIGNICRRNVFWHFLFRKPTAGVTGAVFLAVNVEQHSLVCGDRFYGIYYCSRILNILVRFFWPPEPLVRLTVGIKSHIVGWFS